MWIVYVALAVALVVGIRYLRKLQAESKPKQPRTLKNFQSDWKREKRLQARSTGQRRWRPRCTGSLAISKRSTGPSKAGG